VRGGRMAAAGTGRRRCTRHHGDMDFDHTGALIVSDVQRGFDAPVWGDRDNPDAEANIGRLVSAWSDAARPIVLVRHDDSDFPGSPLAADAPGFALKPIGARPPPPPAAPGSALKPIVAHAPHDLFVTKTVNSAFYGDPDLHAWLSERGIRQLVLCGIQTNMCVETM